MRAIGSSLFALFLVLGHNPARAEEAPAAGPSSVPSRILRPLPDYHPFDASSSPPLFFPDEVEKRVRELVIDSLTHREAPIEGHVLWLIHKDAELKKERGSVTGLTDTAMEFFHNAIRGHDLYLAALKSALASAPAPEQKRLIEQRLSGDELTQADELLRKSRANRWAGLLNRLLRAVDLLGILSGSYVGAAAETTMRQLLEAGSVEISVEERRALALYREHLRRYPGSRRREEIENRVAALEKKKKAVLVARAIEKAEEAMGKGELDGAELAYETARLIDPQSQSAKDGLDGLGKKLQEREGRRKKAPAAAAALFHETDETEARDDRGLRELLYALSLSGADAIKARARAPEEEQRLSALHQARAGHRLQSLRYVLLGNDVVKKNLLLGTAPLVAPGPAAAGYVAAANLIMIGGNFFELLTANPISRQPILDQGAAYLRHHPDSPDAGEVYAILAQAYEAAGRYDKAIVYHQKSAPADGKKIAQVKEKAAQALLQAAEKSAERSTQEAYLKTILDDYPESAGASEATQRLARLVQSENRGLRMSKQFLRENPELYGPEGLGLKSNLFDGDSSNMEIAEPGVSIANRREMLIHLETPWGMEQRTYPLAEKTAERLHNALRKNNYGGGAELPERQLLGAKEKKWPWETRLAFGTDGRTPFGGLELPLPFIRGLFPLDFFFQGKAGGPSLFPQIRISREEIDDEALYR